MKARMADPALGLRGQLLAEAQVRQRMEEAQARGDQTPAGLLRLMRPRSQLDSDSADDADPSREQREGEAPSEPFSNLSRDREGAGAATSAVIPAKSVPDMAQPLPLIRGDQEGSNSNTVQIPASNVYELNKAHPDAQIGDDPKDAVRLSGSSGGYERFRTFVFGLDYVNERVLMADQASIYYLLQDANYNVRAYLDSEGAGGIECDYEPYGRTWVRHSSDPPDAWYDHEYNPDSPTSFYDLPGFQGGTPDRENGLICFGHRCLDPDLGRWLQVDPNGTGLVLSSSLRYNGQAPSVGVSFDATLQNSDGPHLYQFVNSNPITRADPSGLFSYMDIAGSTGIQGDMSGMYMDIGASTIDAMKGIALYQNERSAAIDMMLGEASSAADWSGIDNALSIYDTYQAVTTGLFLGGVGAKIGQGALSFGRRAFGFFTERAGGRHALLEGLEASTHSRRALFEAGGGGGSDAIGFLGRIEKHHPLPKFLGGKGWQRLARLPAPIHTEFHRVLHENLRRKGFPNNLMGGPTGSAEEWVNYLKRNPGSQRQAFDAILDASRQIDRKHGTTLVHSVWNEIVKGRFESYP